MPNRSTWLRLALFVAVAAVLALAARTAGGSLLDTLRRLHGGH
jgi:hypothetical protein